jgi:hypothetical protein
MSELKRHEVIGIAKEFAAEAHHSLRRAMAILQGLGARSSLDMAADARKSVMELFSFLEEWQRTEEGSPSDPKKEG